MALATDNFTTFNGGVDGPYIHAETVTKSDSVNLTYATRALYVGGAGDVALLTISGETVTFVAVPAGTTIRIRITRVNSTSTTATNMVALS